MPTTKHSKTAAEKEALIQRFDNRANELQSQSKVILTLIAIILALVLYTFYDAADITKSDVKAISEVKISDQIKEQLSKLEKSVDPKLAPKIEKKTKNDYNKKLTEFFRLSREFKQQLFAVFKATEQEAKKTIKTKVKPERIDIPELFGENLNFSIPGNISEKSARIKFTRIKFLFVKDKTTFENIINDKDEANPKKLKPINSLKELILKASNLSKKINNLHQTTLQDHGAKLKIWQDTFAANNKKIVELKKQLAHLSNEKKIPKQGKNGKPIQNSEEASDIALLVQTNITRFGPMLIAFFFVSILINLYRYNRRLSAYYIARSDSLRLLDMNLDTVKFEKLASILSPETHDIGKAPSMPIDLFVNMTKTVVGAIKPEALKPTAK